jgi:hypothetical protein
VDAREILRRTPLRVHEGPFALAAWEIGTELPRLEGFGFVVCDGWETTALVLEEDLGRFPEPERIERGFSVLTLDAPMAWDVVGVLALVTEALAAAGIPAGACAAFRRDHLLVPAARLEEALTALRPLCA